MVFKNLNDLMKHLQKQIDQEVTFEQLFTDDFMIHNTRFYSFSDFQQKSGFSFSIHSDLDLLEMNKLDNFIMINTDFNSFEEMKQSAATIYLKDELKKKGIQVV